MIETSSEKYLVCDYCKAISPERTKTIRSLRYWAKRNWGWSVKRRNRKNVDICGNPSCHTSHINTKHLTHSDKEKL